MSSFSPVNRQQEEGVSSSHLSGAELSQLPTHEQSDLGSAVDNQGLGKDF